MQITDHSRTDRAFAAFSRAIETGETDSFIRLATPDFAFQVPLPFPDWKDEQRGIARFEELVRLERETVELRVRLIPLAAFEEGDHGLVVFRSEGTLWGQPYSNELAIRFEFAGEKVRRFREYLGTVVTA